MADTPEELEKKIIKQVEYYFSDSNLPRDKFLLGEMAKNTENYVSVEVIASFTRMKALTTDLSVVKEALKKSTILALSEDGSSVRRTTPLPENVDFTKRKIYARRIPDNTTIEQVEALFSPFGKVTRVQLRKTPEGIFKRSVFVEFSTEQEAEEALKQKITFDGAELTLLSVEAYNQEKKEEIEQKKGKKRKAKTEDSEKKQGEGEQSEPKQRDYTPGTVLKFDGIAPTTLGALKDKFNELGKVQFVTYAPDATSGYVRYQTPEETQKSLSHFTENLSLLGPEKPSITLLSGDEEKSYWEIALKEISERGKNKGKGNRRGPKRGGSGGRGGRGGKKRRTE
eukprot:TRINITY_DN1243_c0_g1_i1.p1 TRINITY_DN1243_c0_g1~~TRINITY_DN1243_c0_g1_i1.p1  ORF type:complete len:360 (-),score=116.84 TRINITY_DN1243_c0_g1_i1:253-1272(-)